MTEAASNPMSNLKIRLGTRASKLALWQADWTAEQLRDRGHCVDIIQITTEGDTAKESLNVIGGQGVFTKRIQHALLDQEIDLAVHSLKDLPTAKIDGLTIAAVPKRESTFDVLVSNEFQSIDQLPANSTVGTGSARRAAQLKNFRSDLVIKDIRGNVDTRLKKLDDGQYAAIILAEAGLVRLGMHNRIVQRLNQQWMLPAIGQGALGLETRKDDSALVAAVSELTHVPTYQAVTAERAMLRRLEAGCLAPVGCLSAVNGIDLNLIGAILSHDGSIRIEARTSNVLDSAEALGESLADLLLEKAEAEGLPHFWK